MSEPRCNGSGYIQCWCGGDLCVCGMDSVECPGCKECDPDDDDWENADAWEHEQELRRHLTEWEIETSRRERSGE
jgi:hypothetical protein